MTTAARQRNYVSGLMLITGQVLANMSEEKIAQVRNYTIYTICTVSSTSLLLTYKKHMELLFSESNSHIPPPTHLSLNPEQ